MRTIKNLIKDLLKRILDSPIKEILYEHKVIGEVVLKVLVDDVFLYSYDVNYLPNIGELYQLLNEEVVLVEKKIVSSYGYVVTIYCKTV